MLSASSTGTSLIANVPLGPSALSSLPPDDPGADTLDRAIDPNRAAAIMKGREIPCILHYLPNPFPARNRPLWIINPGGKISYGANEAAYQAWVNCIDGILATRAVAASRNGIIHTGSYDRVKQIIRYSKHTAHLITHDSGSAGTSVSSGFNYKGERASDRDRIERLSTESCLHFSTVEKAVDAYRELAGLGYAIVSPRLTTGFSFPDDQCRFNILSKAPFPSMDDLVTLVRASIYADYIPDQVAQIAAQATGRGNRHVKDWCEGFILDLAMVPYLGEKRWMLPPNTPIEYWKGPGPLPPLLVV